MIGHHTRLRENDDLPVWRAPAIKKKPPLVFLLCARLLRSKDACDANFIGMIKGHVRRCLNCCRKTAGEKERKHLKLRT